MTRRKNLEAARPNVNGVGDYFSGDLDEVRIYNTAITDPMSTDSSAALIGYYRFDGSDPGLDSSSYANHGAEVASP